MTFDERVQELQRELIHADCRNRRLTIIVTILIAVGLLLLLLPHRGAIAQKEPNVHNDIRSENFTLINKDGLLVAGLSVIDDAPSLVMYDKKGDLRVELSILPNVGPRLTMLDENGCPRVSLRVVNTTSQLLLQDARAIPRASLRISGDGSGYFWLYDHKNDTVWSAP